MPDFFNNASPFGQPGPGNTWTASPRQVTYGNRIRLLPGGKIISGTASRDTLNTGALTNLRPGLPMGKITASSKYAPSILGFTSAALAGGGTSLTVVESCGDEIVRRLGATGTLKLTGPAAASGTVRTVTVTYSAVAAASGGNRVLTITAPGVNQVEQIDFNVASTAGNLKLNVQKTDGTFVTTANIAWNATDATYLAAINSALDTATGVVGGIVATAIPATDTDLGFRLTYSGTGYAGLAWQNAEVALFPTTSTAAVYTPITAPVNGAFVSGSWVQPVDGSETMRTFVNDGFGIIIDPDNVRDVEFPKFIEEADVDASQLIFWPADTSLQTYMMTQLNANGGKFYFKQLF